MNGGFHNEEKLKWVFVCIIFAVLLREIGVVDNVAYHSILLPTRCMTLFRGRGLCINRYCCVADLHFLRFLNHCVECYNNK